MAGRSFDPAVIDEQPQGIIAGALFHRRETKGAEMGAAGPFFGLYDDGPRCRCAGNRAEQAALGSYRTRRLHWGSSAHRDGCRRRRR